MGTDREAVVGGFSSERLRAPRLSDFGYEQPIFVERRSRLRELMDACARASKFLMLAPAGEEFLEGGCLLCGHRGSFQTSLSKEVVRVSAERGVYGRCIHYAGEPAACVTDFNSDLALLQWLSL